MPYQPEDILDLNTLVQKTVVQEKKWTDLSLVDGQQHLTVADRFLSMADEPVQSGPTQTWTLQTANTGTAKWDELFGQDTTARDNIATLAEQQWALATGNYIFDLREKWFQSDSKKVICDHLAMLMHSARTKGLILFEEALWSSPASSSERPRKMSGFPFWLTTSATEGFTGGDPTGFSSGAGNVTVASVPGWRPWSGTYPEVSNDGLFSRMRNACRKTYFEAPDPYPQATPKKPNWMFYTDSVTLELVERELHSWNDNIRDPAKFYNMGQFNSIPFKWVPLFEKSDSAAYDTTSPVYGINWATFKFEFMEGKALNFHKAERAMNSGHNVMQSNWDASCNLKCLDRRANFHIYKA